MLTIDSAEQEVLTWGTTTEEMEAVDIRLSPINQKIYWFFKYASKDGKRKVSIKDKDLAKKLECSERALYINVRAMVYFGILQIERLPYRGKPRSMPRKAYTFRGILSDACKL